MSSAWFDQMQMKTRLVGFFENEKPKITTFGNTVNQTFEAFVFAALVAWYRKQGWKVTFVHPPTQQGSPQRLTLKYSTRGRPGRYSYALCRKEKDTIQIHHQLRVETHHHRSPSVYNANLCLDIAVIREIDVSGYKTDDALSNVQIVTFGEAKHMPAFAELVAGFIGMVHEMMPTCLKRKGKANQEMAPQHLAPFLYVSGVLQKSALGIIESVQRRNLPISVFSCTDDLTAAFKLHERDFTTEELRAKLKSEEKARRVAKKAKTAAQQKADREHKKRMTEVPF